MSRFGKKMAAYVASSDAIWPVMSKPLGAISTVYRKMNRMRERSSPKHRELLSKIDAILSEPVVKSGPFAGLKYPGRESVGSCYFPKLLGSYERELHGWVERCLKEPYQFIVDVGCAEGYYANGFSLKMPGTKVYAYDIEPKARTICQEMSELNGTNVVIREFCDREELKGFAEQGKGLIIADCEGYEKELISPEVAEVLSGCDFLVEAHDLLDLEITGHLRRCFEKTHDLEELESVDDLRKIYTYEYPELDELTLPEKRVALAENRRTVMTWVFAKSRQ